MSSPATYLELLDNAGGAEDGGGLERQHGVVALFFSGDWLALCTSCLLSRPNIYAQRSGAPSPRLLVVCFVCPPSLVIPLRRAGNSAPPFLLLFSRLLFPLPGVSLASSWLGKSYVEGLQLRAVGVKGVVVYVHELFCARGRKNNG